MNVRAYEYEGHVSFVVFAEQARRPGELDEEMMNRIWAGLQRQDPSLPVEFVDVAPENLPALNRQQEWRIVDGQVVIGDA